MNNRNKTVHRFYEIKIKNSTQKRKHGIQNVNTTLKFLSLAVVPDKH